MSALPHQTTGAASSRVCPYCAESIQLAAKLCPRCRQWLTLRSFRNPVVLLWLWGVPLVAALLAVGSALIFSVERLTDPKPLYTKQLDAFRILDSRMVWRQTASERRLQLIGIITNQSDIPWCNLELECRFFDTNGVLIDVAHPSHYRTIQPHDDAGFSFLVYAARPTNTYASHTITVIRARSARGVF